MPIYRFFLFFILAATGTRGAVIRGTVVENYTGNSLARAVVTLQPIGTRASVVSIRTDSAGNFEFAPLDAGAYLIRAERRGFLPLEYGQKEWNSAGKPIVVAADGQAFINIRLHRFGGITGIVRDENEVGMPDLEVVAYRNSEPPQLAAHATSDDRGVYRVAGLEPGTYLIRTSGDGGSGVSYIPTFSKQTLRAGDAQPVPVYLEEDSKNVDVRPIQGRLFTLSGFAGPIPPLPATFTTTVTLASDMGRRTSGNPFTFAGLPPGPYEIYVEARENAPGARLLGGYAQLTIDRNFSDFAVSTLDVRGTQFDFTGGEKAGVPGSRPNTPGPASIMARRKDLAGTGTPQQLQLNDNRALIASGRWELLVVPPAGHYVSQFAPAPRNEKSRPDAWNEITIGNYGYMRIGISGGASSVHGVVKVSAEPVAGAPVFLEAWDPDSRKRIAELHSTRAGMDGSYRIESLAPGTYRVLSTFDYRAPESAAMDLAGAQIIKIDSHADLQINLDLYGAP